MESTVVDIINLRHLINLQKKVLNIPESKSDETINHEITKNQKNY